MMFQIANPNPEGKKTGDCVVRAIVLAENRKWTDVYTDLCQEGLSMYEMPNSKKVYEAYLTNRGWKKMKMPKHSNGKRLSVRELADKYPDQTLIVSVTKHLTCVKDGCIVDTWDCGRKRVGNYYSR